MTFKSKSEDDIKYLKGIAIARGKNKNIKSFTGYEIYLKKDAAKQNEQIVNEVTVNPELQQPQRKLVDEFIMKHHILTEMGM